MTASQQLPPAFRILFEDNHVIVVCKAPGVLCQGDDSGEPSLLELLKEHVREQKSKPGNVYLGLVHRLDRNTGGVMVYARTSKAAARLSEQFREHSADKLYLAAVQRPPDPPGGDMHDYLRKDARRMKAFVCRADAAGAKEARLSYRTIGERGRSSRRDPLSVVEIELHTGRFHQIRAQFAARGCPLAGDQKYGSTLRLGGPALWARSLSFVHPTRGETLHFTCEPPPEWPFGSRARRGPASADTPDDDGPGEDP